jgi:energy-converting hydrogenase A subunit M
MLQVTSEMGQTLARELDLQFLQVTATKFEDAQHVFQSVARLVAVEYKKYLQELRHRIHA